MAEVRAYFQVAYKVRWHDAWSESHYHLTINDTVTQRIIDNVPRTIDHDCLQALANSVNETLVRDLGVGDPMATSRLRGYFAEDPETSITRDELQAKKIRLEEIMHKLGNFGCA